MSVKIEQTADRMKQIETVWPALSHHPCGCTPPVRRASLVGDRPGPVNREVLVSGSSAVHRRSTAKFVAEDRG
jgi:hypothetical protein